MKMKKVLAVVMAFCMTAGAVSYGTPFISQAITAQAAESETNCISFNEATGVLTLSGELDGNAVRYFNRLGEVKAIVAEKGTVFPKDSSRLFTNYKKCISIDLSKGDTSNVEDMTSMFYGCYELTTLDISGFDTGNVTSMNCMFWGCNKLTNLDVSRFDTSNVTNMYSMFSNCYGLTTIDLSGFDTDSVTNMGSMFSSCSGLTSLDLTGFNTSEVTDMNSMFDGCSKLTKLDLSGFDTSNVTNMYYMFYNCSGLTSLDVSGFDTSNVKNMNGMFNGCDKLTKLDVSGFDTSNVTIMSNMFSGCSSLTSLDVSGFDTSSVTTMSRMFGCSSLTALDVSSFDTGKVETMEGMFSGCSCLNTLDLSSFDTGNVKNMKGLFSGCSGLTKLDVNGFDTTRLKYIDSMFNDCSSLTILDLSGFNTSNITMMEGLFNDCSSLTNLDLSNFDTRKIKDMGYMFEGCSSLTELDLSSFDTSKVTCMYNMLNDCEKLKSLTLGENFRYITKDADLPNGDGWVNANDPKTVISGDDYLYAEIKNSGKNTYKRLPIEEETKPTYPTNIKFEYNEKYHQGRFTWDRVKNADRYSIAIFYAGKWRTQTQNITTNSYITPKTLKPGASYRVAIAARVNGKWDTANAIRHAVTITIPNNDTDGDGILNSKDNQDNTPNNYPSVLVDYINNDIVDMNYTEETDDDFVICKTPLSEILSSCGVNNLTDNGTIYPVNGYYDDWYIMALNRNGKATYGLYKMREQEYDSDDNNDPGVTISFVEFDISKLNDVIYHNTSDTSDLFNEIQKVVQVPDAPYSSELQSYFVDVNSDAPYLIAEAYVDKIANSYSISSIPFPTHLNDIYDEIDNIDGQIDSIMISLIPGAQTIATLYSQRQGLSRVPNALTDCNINFGSIIADKNNKVIKISSSKNLDYNEKRAILSAYTADTSFNMFAAEVQAHADYLDDGLLSSIDKWYSSALRADMAIGEEYESGGFDSYYNPHNIRVVAQANVHGDY